MSFTFKAVVLLGGKTMDRLNGNGKKFTSFSIAGPVLAIELVKY